MAEDSSRGRNRRRYFRRKGGEKGQGGSSQQEIERAATQSPSVPDEGANMERRARVSRRKRRGRNRKGGDVRVDAVVSSGEREVEYRPPDSVLIYTHVVRPSAGAYEFRAEHFSSVGRTLDDYQIDIDSLFAPPDREARRRALHEALADWDFGEDEKQPTSADAPSVERLSDSRGVDTASESDAPPPAPAASSPASE